MYCQTNNLFFGKRVKSAKDYNLSTVIINLCYIVWTRVFYIWISIKNRRSRYTQTSFFYVCSWSLSVFTNTIKSSNRTAHTASHASLRHYFMLLRHELQNFRYFLLKHELQKFEFFASNLLWCFLATKSIL